MLPAQLVWAVPYCAPVSRDVIADFPLSDPADTPPGNCSMTLDTSPGTILATSWWAAWHSNQYPIDDISWSKYDSVIYAFA